MRPGDPDMTAAAFSFDASELAGKRVLPRGQGPALFVQADISALDGVESVVRAALDKAKSLEIRS